LIVNLIVFWLSALEQAWRNWREGKAINIIDPSLSNISKDEIMRWIHIGLLCIQENIVDRPTMASVALMLNSNSLTLSIPSKPAYFMGNGSRRLQDMQQQVDNVTATRSDESANQISITDPYPRQIFVISFSFLEKWSIIWVNGSIVKF
jgi:hypothetical protein